MSVCLDIFINHLTGKFLIYVIELLIQFQLFCTLCHRQGSVHDNTDSGNKAF